MSNFRSNSAIGLTVFEYAGNVDEGNDRHANFSTREEIKAIGTKEVFQLTANWSGPNVIFQSDSKLSSYCLWKCIPRRRKGDTL